MAITTSFTNIISIIQIFQNPAVGVKFLQYSPGEYFFASMKISTLCAIFFSIPIALYESILYLTPSLTRGELEFMVPLVLGSYTLFTLGGYFGHSVLIPVALKFFVEYGTSIIEPFWSFNQYFNFVIFLIFAAGLTFQIPIVQIMSGVLRIISGASMLSYWRSIVLLLTILAAVITPSTDPLTQVALSATLLTLYVFGSGIVMFLQYYYL